jgi:hypothetical protein
VRTCRSAFSGLRSFEPTKFVHRFNHRSLGLRLTRHRFHFMENMRPPRIWLGYQLSLSLIDAQFRFIRYRALARSHCYLLCCWQMYVTCRLPCSADLSLPKPYEILYFTDATCVDDSPWPPTLVHFLVYSKRNQPNHRIQDGMRNQILLFQLSSVHCTGDGKTFHSNSNDPRFYLHNKGAFVLACRDYYAIHRRCRLLANTNAPVYAVRHPRYCGPTSKWICSLHLR